MRPSRRDVLRYGAVTLGQTSAVRGAGSETEVNDVHSQLTATRPTRSKAGPDARGLIEPSPIIRIINNFTWTLPPTAPKVQEELSHSNAVEVSSVILENQASKEADPNRS